MEAQSPLPSTPCCPESCLGKDEDRQSVKERKVVHNASSKVSLVVQKMLFPLLDHPIRTHVVFDVERDQAEIDLMDQLNRNKPEVLEDSRTFVQHLQGLFDRYKQGFASSQRGVYNRVCTQITPRTGLTEPFCCQSNACSTNSDMDV